MNDFLSALLERSTGQAPVLRPRRLSRFEPAGNEKGKSSEGFEAASEERTTPGSHAERPRVEPPAPTFRVERVVERAALPREGPLRMPAPPDVDTLNRIEPATPARGDEVVPRMEERPRERQETPLSNAARPQLVVPQEMTRRTTVQHTVERRTVERLQEPAPAAAGDRSKRSADVLRPAAPSVARPTPTRRSERLPRPAPAPSIHVSIGRIEIRAQQAAPAPPARPARINGPKLDLEQYLAGRHGSGR